MPKNPRWICLEPKCARLVSSKHTGGWWCTCGKYLLPDPIELPRPCIFLGEIDLDECFVSLNARGFMQLAKEIKTRKAAAARSGHLDWQQKVDDADVLRALSNALRRKR